MTEAANAGEITSLRRSFEILEWIHANEGARLSELAESLDLARSSVHNHLTTLKQLGYLTKEGNTYHLSLQFLHLGEYTRHRKPEYSVAKRVVDQLATKTNEEVDFTVPENGRVISLYHSDGDRQSSGRQVGQWFPMHATAAGKAVMAELTEAEVQHVVDQWGLPARTDRTITTLEGLHEELGVVRDQGYAINDQELIEGYHSIAAAAKYPSGEIFGALTIGGPTYRIESALASSDILDDLFRAVEEMGRGIEENADPAGNWWREHEGDGN